MTMLMTTQQPTTTTNFVNNQLALVWVVLVVLSLALVVDAPTWDCGSVLLQLTFWITLWLITFELHSREHFLLGVTLIFFGFFSG
jgi:hypothetical protein